MNNQKDTEKTGMHSYGHSSFSSLGSLTHKPHIDQEVSSYSFANKKTEKLVTALYMVTDCMDTEDALKSKLRTHGVDLLSDMHMLESRIPLEKTTHISATQSRIRELLSFIEIATVIGFVSDMNSAILKREFDALALLLESFKDTDSRFTFTLREEMFEVDQVHEVKPIQREYIKDIDTRIGHINKKTQIPTHASALKQAPSFPKGQIQNEYNAIDKIERSRKIVALIKDNKNANGGVSIKDISVAFTDCSEKTIQRELNSLVAKGTLTKIGAKRWSRYQAL